MCRRLHSLRSLRIFSSFLGLLMFMMGHVAMAEWSSVRAGDPGAVYSCFTVIPASSLVAAGRSDSSTIDFFDASSGTFLATKGLSLPGNPMVSKLAVATNMSLIALCGDGSLTVLYTNGNSGLYDVASWLRFPNAMPPPQTFLVVQTNMMLYNASNGTIAANVDTGAWAVLLDAGTPFWTSVSPVFSQFDPNVFYVAPLQGNSVQIFFRSNLSQGMICSTPSSNWTAGLAVFRFANQDYVAVVDHIAQVQAISMTTCNTPWPAFRIPTSLGPGRTVAGGQIVASSTNRLYMATLDGNFICITMPAAPATQFVVTGFTPIHSVPADNSSLLRVIYGTADGTIQSIDDRFGLNSAPPFWTYKAPSGIRGTIVLFNPLAIFMTDAGKLYAIDQVQGLLPCSAYDNDAEGCAFPPLPLSTGRCLYCPSTQKCLKWNETSSATCFGYIDPCSAWNGYVAACAGVGVLANVQRFTLNSTECSLAGLNCTACRYCRDNFQCVARSSMNSSLCPSFANSSWATPAQSDWCSNFDLDRYSCLTAAITPPLCLDASGCLSCRSCPTSGKCISPTFLSASTCCGYAGPLGDPCSAWDNSVADDVCSSMRLNGDGRWSRCRGQICQCIPFVRNTAISTCMTTTDPCRFQLNNANSCNSQLADTTSGKFVSSCPGSDSCTECSYCWSSSVCMSTSAALGGGCVGFVDFCSRYNGSSSCPNGTCAFCPATGECQSNSSGTCPTPCSTYSGDSFACLSRSNCFYCAENKSCVNRSGRAGEGCQPFSCYQLGNLPSACSQMGCFYCSDSGACAPDRYSCDSCTVASFQGLQQCLRAMINFTCYANSVDCFRCSYCQTTGMCFNISNAVSNCPGWTSRCDSWSAVSTAAVCNSLSECYYCNSSCMDTRTNSSTFTGKSCDPCRGFSSIRSCNLAQVKTPVVCYFCNSTGTCNRYSSSIAEMGAVCPTWRNNCTAWDATADISRCNSVLSQTLQCNYCPSSGKCLSTSEVISSCPFWVSNCTVYGANQNPSSCLGNSGCSYCSAMGFCMMTTTALSNCSSYITGCSNYDGNMISCNSYTLPNTSMCAYCNSTGQCLMYTNDIQMRSVCPRWNNTCSKWNGPQSGMTYCNGAVDCAYCVATGNCSAAGTFDTFPGTCPGWTSNCSTSDTDAISCTTRSYCRYCYTTKKCLPRDSNFLGNCTGSPNCGAYGSVDCPGDGQCVFCSGTCSWSCSQLCPLSTFPLMCNTQFYNPQAFQWNVSNCVGIGCLTCSVCSGARGQCMQTNSTNCSTWTAPNNYLCDRWSGPGQGAKCINETGANCVTCPQTLQCIPQSATSSLCPLVTSCSDITDAFSCRYFRCYYCTTSFQCVVNANFCDDCRVLDGNAVSCNAYKYTNALGTSVTCGYCSSQQYCVGISASLVMIQLTCPQWRNNRCDIWNGTSEVNCNSDSSCYFCPSSQTCIATSATCASPCETWTYRNPTKCPTNTCNLCTSTTGVQRCTRNNFICTSCLAVGIDQVTCNSQQGCAWCTAKNICIPTNSDNSFLVTQCNTYNHVCNGWSGKSTDVQKSCSSAYFMTNASGAAAFGPPSLYTSCPRGFTCESCGFCLATGVCVPLRALANGSYSCVETYRHVCSVWDGATTIGQCFSAAYKLPQLRRVDSCINNDSNCIQCVPCGGSGRCEMPTTLNASCSSYAEEKCFSLPFDLCQRNLSITFEGAASAPRLCYGPGSSSCCKGQCSFCPAQSRCNSIELNSLNVCHDTTVAPTTATPTTGTPTTADPTSTAPMTSAPATLAGPAPTTIVPNATTGNPTTATNAAVPITGTPPNMSTPSTTVATTGANISTTTVATTTAPQSSLANTTSVPTTGTPSTVSAGPGTGCYYNSAVAPSRFFISSPQVAVDNTSTVTSDFPRVQGGPSGLMTIYLDLPSIVASVSSGNVTSSYGAVASVDMLSPRYANSSCLLRVVLSIPTGSQQANIWQDSAVQLSITPTYRQIGPGCTQDVVVAASYQSVTFSMIIAAPRPSSIPTSVTQAASAVSTYSSVSSSVTGAPVMALQQARNNAFKDLVECKFSDVDELDMSTNPTTLGFGSSVGRYYRGAVVGAVILNGGAALLILAVASPVLGLIERYQNPSEPPATAFARGMDKVLTTLHYPSVLVIPFAFTLQGVLTSAVSLIRTHQDSIDIPLAAVGILLPIAFICFVGVMTISPAHFRCVRGKQDDEPTEFERRYPMITRFAAFLESEEQWSDISNSSTEFKKRYVYFFDEYEVRWYLVVELTVSFLFGVVNGVRLNDYNSCKTQCVVILLISLALLAISVALRPLSTGPNNFFSIFSNVSGALSAVFSTINVFQESDTYSSFVDYISTITNFVLGVKTCLDVILLVIKTLRRREKALKLERSMSMKRQNSTCHPQEMDPSRSQNFVLPILEEEDAERLAHLEAKETEEEAEASRKAQAMVLLSRQGLTDLMEIDAFLEKAMKELEEAETLRRKESMINSFTNEQQQQQQQQKRQTDDPFGGPKVGGEATKKSSSTPTSPALSAASAVRPAAQQPLMASSSDDDDIL